MTREEVIERLCKLQAVTARHVGYVHAADCFCGNGGFWGTEGYDERSYRNDGVALDFIEAAVREKIKAQCGNPDPE